jgi:hypothetical protein
MIEKTGNLSAKLKTVFWISLTLFVFYNSLILIFGPKFDRIPGDFIDARFNNYLLEHGYRFLSGKDVNFWSATFLFPEPKVIAYSDNFLGELPLYAMLRISGLEMQSAYQGWMLITLALNFLVCAWVLFKMTGDSIAACIGAFIFAFALPVYDQSIHSQLISRYAIPLIFYFFIRFIRRENPLFLLAALLSFVWQFYNSIYLGFLTTLAFFFFLPSFLVIFRKTIRFNHFFSAKAIIAEILITGFAGVLLYVMMAPYIDQAKHLPPPDHGLVFDSLPHWKSYLLTSANSKTWKVLSVVPPGLQNFWNHLIFPGLFPIMSVFALIVFIAREFFEKKVHELDEYMKFGIVWMITLFGLFLITLHLPRYSFYELIFWLPGFGAMRDLCRVINVELFLFGTIAALAVGYWHKTAKSGLAKYVIGFVFLGAVIYENRYDFASMPTYSKKESEQRITTLADKILSMPNLENAEAVVYMPFINPKSASLQLDGMLACQRLGLKTVNGYTSTCPYMYCNFAEHLDLAGLKEWFGRKNLSVDSVRFIFVH